GAVRVEDLRQDLVLGVDREAGQFGADLFAEVAVLVALGAGLLEDLTPAFGAAGLLGDVHELVEDSLPVGVRQSPALFEDLARPLRQRLVRMGGEVLRLRGVQIAGRNAALVDGVEHAGGPPWTAHQYFDGLGARSRSQFLPAGDQTGGDFRLRRL